MNDDDFAHIINKWGRSKRLTPRHVRSLSRSIRHRSLASAFLVVVGMGAVCAAQAFALGAAAVGASVTVMGYGLVSYWVSP